MSSSRNSNITTGSYRKWTKFHKVRAALKGHHFLLHNINYLTTHSFSDKPQTTINYKPKIEGGEGGMLSFQIADIEMQN